VLKTPEGESVTQHAAKVMKQAERTDTLAAEVARLNATLANTGGYGARERVKVLERENASLRNQATALERALADARTAAATWAEAWKTDTDPPGDRKGWSYRVFSGSKDFSVGHGYSSKEDLRDSLYVALGGNPPWSGFLVGDATGVSALQCAGLTLPEPNKAKFQGKSSARRFLFECAHAGRAYFLHEGVPRPVRVVAVHSETLAHGLDVLDLEIFFEPLAD
jgi:hypothetical protein